MGEGVSNRWWCDCREIEEAMGGGVRGGGW